MKRREFIAPSAGGGGVRAAILNLIWLHPTTALALFIGLLVRF
jgi:hypothetical protein